MFTGIELGIVLSIFCKVYMSAVGLWPCDTQLLEEESLEE